MSQDDVVDAVDMTPEEILDWREKFVYSDTKRPSPTSPSTLKTRPQVPFYIDYLRTDLRCRPYRQKVEACAKCRQLGHRQDVCPNVTISLCPKCGTPDPPEDHSCTPTCIICNGTHETGSSECRLRYKPRTLPPAPPETKLTLLARNNTQASNQHPGQEKPQSNSGRKNSATVAQVLSSKQAWPPLTPRNEERPPINLTMPPPAKRKNADITDTHNTVENAIFLLSERMTTLENKVVALENRLQSKLDAFICEASA
ncbi:hypothetical protein HPB49_011550 [Dermacentor silvarum]|uniref:Uncharacterized protein n=1 Tax=Dermacentor silvarum TaxID=543639 RepID=A0ACB8C3B0_DERSI|nr:hypothetical protein HPB49_011550 [Dermacentor silvarum]